MRRVVTVLLLLPPVVFLLARTSAALEDASIDNAPDPEMVGVDTASTWYLRHVDGSDPYVQSTPGLNAAMQEAAEPPDTGHLRRGF